MFSCANASRQTQKIKDLHGLDVLWLVLGWRLHLKLEEAWWRCYFTVGAVQRKDTGKWGERSGATNDRYIPEIGPVSCSTASPFGHLSQRTRPHLQARPNRSFSVLLSSCALFRAALRTSCAKVSHRATDTLTGASQTLLPAHS